MAVTLPWKDLHKIKHLFTPEEYAELERARKEGRRRPKPTAVARPRLVDQPHEPGRAWVLEIEGFVPVSLNRLLSLHHFEAARLKKKDAEIVAYEAVRQGIPGARGRRRLGVHVSMRGKLMDADNVNKSVRDALVDCGLLIDDSGEWLKGEDPVVVRGPRRTTITLTEV